MFDPTQVMAVAADDGNSALYTFLGQILGGGAVAGALVLVLWKTLSKVADRFLVGFDNITKAVGEHTAKDLAAQGEVREAVSRFEGKLDTILEWQERTPIEGAPPAPRTTPTPLGTYGPGRPGTLGGGGRR